ncbi:adenosylcobinamide-GDP ribazoletransferase [Stutzerimonas urumqiensis]|uniref:adenosylcobinamide-GDP ribazoletransferase n=1 Tax=Stutzerimonas urumqiensis TaxID=638269 RepID=UPI003DA54E71
MKGLRIALGFLTLIPVRLAEPPRPAEIGASLVWYPAVGVLLGLLLLGASAVLSGAPAALHAALLLAIWVAITGALHLDGLADSADAWLGGLGSAERTLAIMKDPRSGPVAVVTLVLVFLLKFSALLVLVDEARLAPLLLAPLIARSALAGLFLCTPYVRQGGLGQALADHLPARRLKAVLVAAATGCLLLSGSAGLLALAAGVGCAAVLRQRMMARLGGTTGDTAGALVEMVECAVLVALALA